MFQRLKTISLQTTQSPPPNFSGIVRYPEKKIWMFEGEPHRETGPAIEHKDGTKEWYFNGVELSDKEYTSFIKIIRDFDKLSVPIIEFMKPRPWLYELALCIDAEDGNFIFKMTSDKPHTAMEFPVGFFGIRVIVEESF